MKIQDYFVRQGLSSREAEVAVLVMQGRSNKSIGNSLYICEKTVKFHMTNIYKKTNQGSRSQFISEYMTPFVLYYELQRNHLKRDVFKDQLELLSKHLKTQDDRPNEDKYLIGGLSYEKK